VVYIQRYVYSDAYLLYRNVKDSAEVAKLSEVEVKEKFRVSIGPSTGK
jgi:hypothetical protein